MRQKKSNIRLVCCAALMCTMLVVSTLLIRFPLPGTDVLFTTQLIFILLSALILPVPYGLYAVVAYLLLGLIGLPVFSSVCGPAVVFTPSFGFLLGFLFAVLAAAYVRSRLEAKKGCDLLAALSGTVVMYIAALTYIAVLNQLWFHSTVSFRELFSIYCAGFLPLDLLKTVLAALIAPRLRKAIGC